jgi:alpha-tubulin suppressor-like RCC1 family protein
MQGTAYVFGSGGYGQLGLGNNDTRNVPTLIPGLPPIRTIAAGGGHTVLVDVPGNIYVCGAGADGRLGLGHNENRYVPTLIPGLQI